MSEDPWEKLIHHEQYTIDFDGLKIQINDNVFTPDPNITYSSEIVRENLFDVDGKRVADIGTGTGVLAITAVKNGAREVVATDTSPEAIENAIRNTELNGLTSEISVIQTDLMTDVDGTFDVILANLPMLDDVWEVEGVDVDSTAKRFLEQVPSKLSVDGKILVPWGSFAEEARVQFEKLLTQMGFTFTVSSKEALGYTWYLYEISFNILSS